MSFIAGFSFWSISQSKIKHCYYQACLLGLYSFFHILDIFEVYSPLILLKLPQFKFVWGFPMIAIIWCILGMNTMYVSHGILFSYLFLFIYFGHTGFYLQQVEASIFFAACSIFSCGLWDLVPWPGMEPQLRALGV